MALLRCEGEVRRIEHKSGTTAKGEPWAFDVVRVLVGDADFTDVVYPQGSLLPSLGQKIDATVRVSIRKGRGDYGPSLGIEYVGNAGSGRKAA